MSSYDKNVVKKPWGYEYLAYENDKVAVWILYLKSGERTSMHCHPNKTTGLVLLDGNVEVSFLSDKKKLSPMNKIMIRKGLFHQTRALEDSFVMELETPVDKGDLVRFKDNYGRKGKPYEDSSFETPKSEDCLWIEEPEDFEATSISKCLLFTHRVRSTDFFEGLEDDRNVIFLKGGILTEYGTGVAYAGDVVSSTVLKELVKVFKKVEEDTVVMTMGRIKW